MQYNRATNDGKQWVQNLYNSVESDKLVYCSCSMLLWLIFFFKKNYQLLETV